MITIPQVATILRCRTTAVRKLPLDSPAHPIATRNPSQTEKVHGMDVRSFCLNELQVNDCFVSVRVCVLAGRFPFVVSQEQTMLTNPLTRKKKKPTKQPTLD